MNARVKAYLNERSGLPSVNSPNDAYYKPGDIVDIEEIVNGEEYEGNSVWYKIKKAGYVWSGGIEGITNILPDSISETKYDATNYWWVNNFGIEKLWNKGLSGSGVKIAILDSGISIPHKDLLLDQTKINDSSMSKNTTDWTGHGTHIAGILVASNNGFGTKGIAYDADLYISKITNDDVGDDVKYLTDAINWAVKNKVDIISISNGTPNNDLNLQAAIKLADKASILVVCAAGNKTTVSGSQVLYPAQYDSTLSVGAIDKTSESLSNSIDVKNTELFAPGKDILSTYLNNSYEKLSGSSQAVPFVAGVAALLLNKERKLDPNFTPKQMKDVLLKFASNDGSLSIINPLSAFEKELNH